VRVESAAAVGGRRLAPDALRAGAGATVAERSGSGGGAGGTGSGGGSAGADDGALLTDRDLKVIERDYPDGITSVQIVDIFTQRGIRFSEATFRKYVQQGLLPRSRRVGRKGKHQGSMGLYPPTTVRRINAIKRLMAENYTIEDIQRQFLRYRDEIEALERSLGAIFTGFETEIAAPHFDAQVRKGLKRDIAEARKAADELVRQIESIERRIAGPTDRPSGAGAPEGAEDLL
jgi:DNA-binding transcriptional MerR regulator